MISNVVKSDYDSGNLELELKQNVRGGVHPRGTVSYEKRRLIHNGLCTHIYPDLIVVPESTEDVSQVVKITNKYNIHISVRSGGHSFTCQSTKQGKVFLLIVWFFQFYFDGCEKKWKKYWRYIQS